jgi:hypothetical protein
VKFTHFVKSALSLFIGFLAFLPVGITAAALVSFLEILCQSLGPNLFWQPFELQKK